MSSPRNYFGGDSVHGGRIRRLAASSFKDLVDKYFNVPCTIQMERAEFFAASNDTQNSTKDGPYVTPCSFKDVDQKRSDANADKLTLVCMDFDPGNGEHDYAKDFFESPETVSEALYPYNFILYTTARHQPHAPRIRIMVDIEEMPVNRHKAIVRHIATLLGIGDGWKGFRESNVLSQPMYRPVQFLGSPFDAVLVSRVNGKSMDEMDIPDHIEEEIQRTYAYRGDTDCQLAFLPSLDLTVADIQEPLNKISPDIEYKEWCHIASALRHQFREEEDARAAYEAFDLWSSRGEKYKGEDETYAKWNSFKPDAVGKRPVTIKTLFGYAIDAGWVRTKLATKIHKSFDQWLDEATEETVGELLEQGAFRIAEMPLTSAMIEETMGNALRKRIKDLKGGDIDKATVLREIKKERGIKKAEESSGDIPGWLRPWCYVTTANVFRNVTNDEMLTPEAFNNTFSSELMGKPEEEAALQGRPSILPVHKALNVVQIKKVGGVTYDPRHGGNEPFFTLEGRDYLNLYRKNSLPKIERDQTRVDKVWRIFCNHIGVLVGDPEYQRIMIDFLAFIIQKPGEKIRWSIIIQSAEGAGKSILAGLMGAAIGAANVKLVSPNVMKSDFNDWSFGSQLCILEELHITGAYRDELMNKLKMAITDSRITINQKFQDMRVMINITNYLGFTNFPLTQLSLKESNRRYMPIESPLQTKEMVENLTDSNHFGPLKRIISEYGGALRAAFLQHQISPDFNPDGPAPSTRYVKQIVDNSKNDLQLFIEDLIEDEEQSLICEDVIDIGKLMEKVVAARLDKHNHRPTHYLKILGYEPYMDGRKFNFGSYRTAIWVHRQKFDPELDSAEILLRERKLKNSEDLS